MRRRRVDTKPRHAVGIVRHGNGREDSKNQDHDRQFGERETLAPAARRSGGDSGVTGCSERDVSSVFFGAVGGQARSNRSDIRRGFGRRLSFRNEGWLDPSEYYLGMRSEVSREPTIHGGPGRTVNQTLPRGQSAQPVMLTKKRDEPVMADCRKGFRDRLRRWTVTRHCRHCPYV